MSINKWRDDIYCPQCETERYMNITMESETGVQYAECVCGIKLVNHGWQIVAPGNAQQQVQADNSCEHSFSPVYQCVHCGKIGDSIA